MGEGRRALLVVDVQPTFCEGGALPVAGGNDVAEAIARYAAARRDRYDLVVTTQDWHIDPGEHFSEHPDFVDTWPPHGVAGTTEAELHPALSELGLDPENTMVSIGTTPLARAFLVPEAMSLMVAEKFPASFRVLEGNWGDLVESLRDGVIDLIVGELPAGGVPDLEYSPLYTEAPIIVAGHQHDLVGKENPSHQTLASYPWIIGPETSPLRAEWERLFPGKRPQMPVECGSIMIIGRLLTSSDGTAERPCTRPTGGGRAGIVGMSSTSTRSKTRASIVSARRAPRRSAAATTRGVAQAPSRAMSRVRFSRRSG